MRKGAPTSLLASEACQQKSASFDHIFSGSALPNNRIISIDQPSVIIFFTTKCIVLNLHIYIAPYCSFPSHIVPIFNIFFFSVLGGQQKWDPPWD